LCSGLWLPIRELRTTLRSVALPFSSSGDRPGRWDFNPLDITPLQGVFFRCPVCLSFFLSLQGTQSPPVPCGTGSVYHQPVLHRYYGFIRPLLTHCFCFPIQVILRLPFAPSVEFIDPETSWVLTPPQGGR